MLDSAQEAIDNAKARYESEEDPVVIEETDTSGGKEMHARDCLNVGEAIKEKGLKVFILENSDFALKHEGGVRFMAS
jgi:hypothetical protein